MTGPAIQASGRRRRRLPALRAARPHGWRLAAFLGFTCGLLPVAAIVAAWWQR